MYVGRRPKISAVSPTNVGAIVATAIYEVIVRLTLSTETPSDFDIESIAGKYIKLLSVENQAAYDTIAMMDHFSVLVKTE